jgi:uncharacterized paraquat-inducible protein A
MALVACEECGAQISSNAIRCPRCGHRKVGDNFSNTTRMSIALAFAAILFYLFFWPMIKEL